jgi:hypothetical protein
MMELILVLLVGLFGFTAGLIDANHTYQEKCVAKYSYMPHNQVGEYCKTILKFEKETK